MLRFSKLLVLLALVILVGGCGSGKNPLPEGKPLTVIATIYPLADITGQLGGDQIQVDYLLPPGASPHTYEATVEQARQISEADLFLYIGAGLDDWAVKLAGESGNGPLVVDLSHYVPILDAAGYDKPYEHNANGDKHDHEGNEVIETRSDHDHDHGLEDPHYWLDPLIVRDYLAPAITTYLQQIDPQHEERFIGNLEKYKEELTVLDSLINRELANPAGRYFITFHSAWRYFAGRYGLEEIAVITHFPGQEPSAGWLADLVHLIEEYQISAILAEPQFSTALADRIAEESGIEVLLVDPLGGVEGRLTYIDMMHYNLDIFVRGLSD